MIKLLLFVSFLLPCFWLPVHSAPSPEAITVYLFLREDCLVSQYYTVEINKLYEAYSSDRIVFKGVFPNATSTELGIAVFKEKYKLPFGVTLDPEQVLTRKFSAKITPEVVVYDHLNNQIIYQGRIDNGYVRVGKRRRVITETELKDVLTALQCGEEKEFEDTEAVGCFIQFLD